MNRKKLLAQQHQCLALATMKIDELAYRQELNHPDSVINAYLGPIQAYQAEYDHLLWQFSQLTDGER